MNITELLLLGIVLFFGLLNVNMVLLFAFRTKHYRKGVVLCLDRNTRAAKMVGGARM